MTDLIETTESGLTVSARTPRIGPRRFKALVGQSLLGALAFEIIIFTVLTSRFLTVANFTNIAVQSSIIGIVSVAFGLLLITGYIDLSVGSTLAFTAVVAGNLLDGGHPAVVAVLGALAAGALVGAVNGFLTAYLGLAAIIVTLGSLTAVRGLAIGQSLNTPGGFDDAFRVFGVGKVGPVPVPVLIVTLVFLIGGFVLKSTVFGRHAYAVGVNAEAAYLAGIKVRSIPFWLYVAVGVAAAIGGIITAARIDASPGGTIGNGFEMGVLTAVLLGGISFGGGRGGVFGILLGVAFMAILQNGLTTAERQQHDADAGPGCGPRGGGRPRAVQHPTRHG